MSQSGYTNMDPAVRSLGACKMVWFFLQLIRYVQFTGASWDVKIIFSEFWWL